MDLTAPFLPFSRSSRRASIASHASAAYSQAGSTRHILADMHGTSSSQDFSSPSPRNNLYPPTFPTPSRGGSPSPLSPNPPGGDASSVSLSVNYLPHKFSSTLLAPSSLRKRRKGEPPLPKRGGGVEAFRSGEARMPGANDEDYDGVDNKSGRKLRWNRFKWVLFGMNLLLTAYSLTALIIALLTWFNVFTHSDIIRVGNHPELVLSTVAASLGLFTSMVGWSGILLNNRAFLAWYTFLLWAVLAFLVTPGYITYKKRTFNLEGKINSQWSRNLGTLGRLRIQNELNCCGYYSPYVEATVSQTCYSRSVLPGCKAPYLDFEREILRKWYTAVFALVPVHIGVILAGLLCSNHVTYRFGKGMMPEAYRLNVGSMAVIMDNYATQLAEQYGTDIASEVLSRSRSNLNLNTMQSMPYQSTSPGVGRDHVKYDSVGGRAPEAM